MKKNLYRRGLALLLAVCTLLSCAGCGEKVSAATMHLRKTEGTVGVSDNEGKGVELRENLGLYSGYGVGTEATSYAWIDLDSVKLTKLDENSEVGIKKEDKHLTIEVKSGSLFFNVTEPLADDETMEIRTSSMLVGIRGTCGWVEVNGPEHMTLYLLEGTVECTAGPVTTTVDAGKMAVMTAGTAGNEIAVSEFSAADVPAFVLEEIEEDSELADMLELLRQRAERARVLETAAYYGDPANCVLTAEQAEELARAIEERAAANLALAGPDNYSGSFAALFDPGCGVPALLFTSGSPSYPDWADMGEIRPFGSCVLYYKDGVLNEKDGEFYLYADHLLLHNGGGTDSGDEVYSFADGQIPDEPVSTYSWTLDYPDSVLIDGVEQPLEERIRWQEMWQGDDSIAYTFSSPDGYYGQITGMSPAEDVIAALNNFLQFSRRGV